MQPTGSKRHFGPLKGGRLFLTSLGSKENADLVFYNGYDPSFILKKIAALLAVYRNPAGVSGPTASDGPPIGANDSSFLGAIATEIHCAMFHQIEGLIALLLAEYQPRPDWVYLSSYANTDIKNAAHAIASGDFQKVTCGESTTAEEFTSRAVYAGFTYPDGGNQLWKKSVSDIGWFIGYCAESYLAGFEYNAYKHGLRVVSGSAELAVGPGSGGQMKTVLTMKHSLTYLELFETLEGYIADQVTKDLSPDYSAKVIETIAGILSIVRDMRVGRIKQQVSAVNCLDLDRVGLSRSKPSRSMRFSY